MENNSQIFTNENSGSELNKKKYKNTFLRIMGNSFIVILVLLWILVVVSFLKNGILSFFSSLAIVFILLPLLGIFLLLFFGSLAIKRKNLDQEDKLIFKIVIVCSLFSLLIVFLMQISSYRLYLKAPSESEKFYDKVARTFNLPEFCEKLSSYSGSSYPSDMFKTSAYLSKSRCYQMIAYAFKNPSLCSQVKPVSTLFADGKEINEKSCLKDFKDGFIYDAMPDIEVIDLFIKLGYKNEVANLQNFDINKFDIYNSEDMYKLMSISDELKNRVNRNLFPSVKQEFVKRLNQFIEKNYK